MPYVQRNQAGVITGIYSNPQPGLAEEFQESPEIGKSYGSELAELNAAYQLDVDKFNRAFAIAYLSDGPSQEAKQASIRAQYEARKALHIANISALDEKYSGGV